MTSPGRQFNDAVTRFWSFAAPVYDLPFLQRLVYQPAQDEVVAELRARGVRRVGLRGGYVRWNARAGPGPFGGSSLAQGTG